MFQQARRHWLAVILMAVLLGACATLTTMQNAHKDRGLKPPHKQHEKEGLACEDCHAATEPGEPGMPNHDVCSTCHDFDEAKPDERCDQCHTWPDRTVGPRVKSLDAEIKFNHPAHTGKGVECAKCHADPDRARLPGGNLMKFCMDCHGATRPELNACRVCHSELDTTVRPKFRHGVRLPHDNPQLWESLHGRESRRDPDYCNLCHDQEASCEDCHRKNPPRSHTVAWRGRSHGLRASWDREKCSVCHEEDSCIKCHKNSQPNSHRGGWGEPLNRHCVNCHYPPSSTGCTVCHESIEHPKALASPHNLGIYGQCGWCHPGGIPYRAPHMMNTSIRCLACH